MGKFFVDSPSTRIGLARDLLAQFGPKHSGEIAISGVIPSDASSFALKEGPWNVAIDPMRPSQEPRDARHVLGGRLFAPASPASLWRLRRKSAAAC